MPISLTTLFAIIAAFLWIAAGCSTLHVQERPVHLRHYYPQMIGELASMKVAS